ncbi:hypothetical protein MXD63_34150 [Frankia sp. Cpl3]|nr:hypothetical protein [Parafrankia colletiae]MCK9905047.1 hypothetical protein [Frankia sp. Cpl3]
MSRLAPLDLLRDVGTDAGLPLHRFRLNQTAAAHDAVEAGIVGKVLVDVTRHP